VAAPFTGGDVVGDALRALRRRAWTHLAVEAVAIFLFVLLFGLWLGCVMGLTTYRPEGRLAFGLSGLALFAGGLCAWSIFSTFHRAVVIAVASRRASPSLRDATRSALERARSLIALGLILGAFESALLLAAALAWIRIGRGSVGHFTAAALVLAWWLIGWVATRPLLGIATANIVIARETIAGALRNSARELSGHRGASLRSRVMVVSFASLAAVVTSGALSSPPGTSPGWWLGLAVSGLLAPVLVSFDAIIEACWYDRLRGAADPRELAAIFD
jgi:hypothetical protein